MTVVDLDGKIHSHFRTDEEYVAGLPRSTYTDERTEQRLMSINAAQQKTPEPPTPTSDREMLDFVYRELVSIHASMEDTTHSDRTIIPWAKRELMDVIRTLGAFRKTPRDDKQAVTTDRA